MDFEVKAFWTGARWGRFMAYTAKCPKCSRRNRLHQYAGDFRFVCCDEFFVTREEVKDAKDAYNAANRYVSPTAPAPTPAEPAEDTIPAWLRSKSFSEWEAETRKTVDNFGYGVSEQPAAPETPAPGGNEADGYNPAYPTGEAYWTGFGDGYEAGINSELPAPGGADVPGVKDELHAAMLQVKADLKLAGVIPGHWDVLCDAVETSRAENATLKAQVAEMREALEPFPYVSFSVLADVLMSIKVAGFLQSQAAALGHASRFLRQMDDVRAARLLGESEGE